MRLADPDAARIGVIHSTHVWLSQTMTWLHTQVQFLPSNVTSHVVCDRVQNLDQFPIPNLIAVESGPPLWRFLASHSWQIHKWRQYALRVECAQRRHAQVLHSHFGDQGWFDLAAAAAANLRHVVTFYGYDASRLPLTQPVWRKRYLELFERADLFLCEGPHLMRRLTALGCPAHKAKVHHLGLDLARIAFRPRSWTPGSPLRMLIAGSFTEKKGIPYALEALGEVARGADVDITVIGDADHQPRNQAEKARILDVLQRTGLAARTRLLGYQPYSTLLAEARNAHVFVSPSVTAADGDTEGGAPVSIIEMAASGMPVVSTDHCDIPEVLEDGRSGLLAAERSVEELVAKLEWLIAHPAAWGDIALAARRHIEAEFDAVVQGQRLARHYESMLVTS